MGNIYGKKIWSHFWDFHKDFVMMQVLIASSLIDIAVASSDELEYMATSMGRIASGLRFPNTVGPPTFWLAQAVAGGIGGIWLIIARSSPKVRVTLAFDAPEMVL